MARCLEIVACPRKLLRMSGATFSFPRNIIIFSNLENPASRYLLIWASQYGKSSIQVFTDMTCNLENPASRYLLIWPTICTRNDPSFLIFTSRIMLQVINDLTRAPGLAHDFVFKVSRCQFIPACICDDGVSYYCNNYTGIIPKITKQKKGYILGLIPYVFSFQNINLSLTGKKHICSHTAI